MSAFSSLKGRAMTSSQVLLAGVMGLRLIAVSYCEWVGAAAFDWGEEDAGSPFFLSFLPFPIIFYVIKGEK